MSDFVHLHNHTNMSVLDGVATPREYFEECANRKYPAIAITEHGNCASVPDAFFASQDTGVKFICGSEIYYNDFESVRKKFEEEGTKIKDIENEELVKRVFRQRHLTVLCKNMNGYKNLLKARKDSYNNFYNRPRCNLKILYENRDDLLILSGCMNGPISYELLCFIEYGDKKFKDNAFKVARNFKKVFGDDYYIELQMPGVDNDEKLFVELHTLAGELNIKTVITNDCHYMKEGDYYVQRIMMSIEQNTTFNDPNMFISKSTSGYFKTREELRNTFLNGHKIGDDIMPAYNGLGVSLSDFEVACDNTLEIADKCSNFDPDLSTKLPAINDADNKLKILVAKGLKEKGLNKKYIERAKFELGRIIEKEFSSYFLICRDLVSKSVDMGIPVGPRGSAGGSLVCYLIGIHDVDPIKFSLSFDRFLSSSRGGKMLRVHMSDDEIDGVIDD